MTRKKKIKTDIPDELRAPLLEAALVHVPFDGWTAATLRQAAADLDIDYGLARLAFPEAPSDMIDALAAHCDAEMSSAAKLLGLDNMKVREKITTLIRLRLEVELPHREAARRALTWLMLPQNQPLAVTLLNRTVDLMWKLAGDTSRDFNYYTKRLTLAGVYSSCFLYWLGDESESQTDTKAFIDRRIEDVMKIEKGKAEIRTWTDRLPDLWRGLGKMRYGQ
ncbi:COQ9 family protein [Emcibacter nanhaiensis]|uniref:COQ9 family protein n=1 Tax=Emcibacter nanhaiensis TaxID=1505037 RepID=A0A501PCY2_9PROT|nr:COQ9 family protein [Emcibacter nanhaiensis]TPD57764.1 COQ9 family protein [Emcibacter nanhaiensis]